MHLHHGLQDAAPEFQMFNSRRSVVYSSKGMAAASQPIACEAGLTILRQGGNALDAAIAVSSALALLEPCSCGMGGDLFVLYFDAKTNKVHGMNGSGRSPKALDLAKARELGITGKEIPLLNLNSVTVPGCAAGWVDSHALYGSGKLTLAEVLAPAIALAENGVPISELTSTAWRKAYKHLSTASPSGHEMLIADPKTGEYHSPAPGEIKKNPDLANTFKSIAAHGKKGYYEGRIAEAIVELIQSKGGVMTMEDLKSHTSTVVDPITYSYGGKDGVTLHECPPNGQGITALIAIGIIEALEEEGVVNLAEMEHNSTAWLHLLIEALRLAFADTRAYVADPAMANVPVKELLSKPYLKERSKLFSPLASNPHLKKGTPFSSSDTVYFTVSDDQGNACSFIQSNYAGFGTFAVPKGCGFTLQNRGCNFILEEGHPNCIEGGKRPYHTIIPAIVTRGEGTGGDLFMSYSCMGGFNQPQAQVQILLNMIQKNFNVQQAIDAPRFCISAGMPDNDEAAAGVEAGDINSEVFLEDGITVETRDALRAMGHNVEILAGHQRGLFGRAQAIQRLPQGVWAGGSDGRADGHAACQI